MQLAGLSNSEKPSPAELSSGTRQMRGPLFSPLDSHLWELRRDPSSALRRQRPLLPRVHGHLRPASSSLPPAGSSHTPLRPAACGSARRPSHPSVAACRSPCHPTCMWLLPLARWPPASHRAPMRPPWFARRLSTRSPLLLAGCHCSIARFHSSSDGFN